MFIKENSSLFSYYTESSLALPTSMKFTDCTLPPRSNNTFYSGAYLIAMYADFINFKKNTSSSLILSDSDIRTKIYNNSATISGTCITLSSGMKACAQNVFGISQSNVLYFNTVDMIKNMLHRYHAVIVEFALSTSITPTSSNPSGIFQVDTTGTLVSGASLFTKGFVAVGYDADYLLVQNSLGRAYGSLGFSKIKWSVVTSLLVKASCIKGLLNS